MSKNGFLEGRQRLLVIIFALFIFAIHLSYFMGGLPLALLTSLATFFLLWISQLVWSSPDYGKFRISLAIFSLVGFISLTILQRGHWLVCLLRILKQSELTWAIKIENFLNCFTTPITTHFSLNALVLIFNLLSIYLVLKFLWSDRTMQKNSNSLDRDFEEQSYIEWLKCFRGVLQKNSGYSNDRTFSKTHFIDLQAEIETTKSGLKLKKRVALIPFIKSELENKNILLLGDSGAGKSLTLSQLEERLIKNKNDISLTPIYINCKYWTESKEWVQQGKEPTVDDLKDFINKSLYRFNGADSKKVLDQDYRKIMERKGKFLFLLDSFDEIPAILELERSDELVKKLWKVIETFVEDHKSRYIVASRFKPESELQSDSDRSIFEILPFSDIQIEKALNESLKYNKDETIKELFTNRSELIPIARNPFMMALLCQYAATEDKNRLPDRQIELYENHFTTRLKSKQCQKKIKKLNLELSVTQIIDKCVDIAWLMFKNNYGLEISVSDLKKELQIISQNKKTNNIIEVLKIAGLIRFGGADKETFSFVHRRFNDYLVVKYLFANPKEVIPDNILNPKWRDILILYYDLVASENPQEAKKIANFCWQKIKNAQESCCDKNDNNKLDALNSIRFLASAFKSKPKYIESIRPDIFKFIEQQVTEKNNIFFAKNSIEAVGILTNEQIDRICLIGLETNNDLISKTAIRYCRHLPKTSKQLQLGIIDYLESIPFLEFIRRIQEILFDFKLADGFQRIKRYCCFRILDSSILILFIFLKILFLTPGFTIVFSSAIIVCLSFMMLNLIRNYDRELGFYRSISEYFIDNTMLGILRFIAVFFASLDILVLYFFPIPQKVEYISRSLPIIDPLRYGLGDTYFSVLLIITSAFFICSIPWYRLPDNVERLPYFIVKNKSNWKSFLLLFVISLLIILVGQNQALVIFINTKVWPGLLSSIGLIWAILMFKGGIEDWCKESKVLKELKQTKIESREDIEKYFKKFHNKKYRLKYVKHIQEELKDRTPTGFWTNDKPPNYRNYRNDRASILLAELEEKWRKLS